MKMMMLVMMMVVVMVRTWGSQCLPADEGPIDCCPTPAKFSLLLLLLLSHTWKAFVIVIVIPHLKSINSWSLSPIPLTDVTSKNSSSSMLSKVSNSKSSVSFDWYDNSWKYQVGMSSMMTLMMSLMMSSMIPTCETSAIPSPRRPGDGSLSSYRSILIRFVVDFFALDAIKQSNLTFPNKFPAAP